MKGYGVVFNYSIYGINTSSFINIPVNAEILSARHKDGNFYIYALVPLDHQSDLEQREFLIAGTGHSFDMTGFKYVDRVDIKEPGWGQTEIYHVFVKEV